MKKRWFALGCAVVGLAMLALAGCGSSGSSGSAAPSPSASPSRSVASWSEVVESSESSATSTLVVDIPGKDATFAEMKQMYDYDRGEPLAFTHRGTTDLDGVAGQLIEYTSAGCTVPGLLVVPKGKGPFPVVLCAPGGTTTTMLYEGDLPALARMGIAALAIDPPDGRQPNVDLEAAQADAQIEGNARYVVDLRRGLDLLETLPRIDSTRIGFIGESWGGAMGALLAGVDQRIKAYVLTYAGGSIRGLKPLLVGQVQDPAQYIAHNSGAAFLFQYTKEDFDNGAFRPRYIASMFAVTPGPKTFQWVRGAHGEMFLSPQSKPMRFHRVWLKKHL
jgi:dienelactone hydrolase